MDWRLSATAKCETCCDSRIWAAVAAAPSCGNARPRHAAGRVRIPWEVRRRARAMAEEDPGGATPRAARGAGITEVARKAGLSWVGLYKALLPDGDPQLSTLMASTRVFGMKLWIG